MRLDRQNLRITFPKIEVPAMQTTYEIELDEAINVTEYGRWWLTERRPIAGGASFGNAVENKILDHVVSNTSYTMPVPYLALWTSTLDDSSTAATSGELTYT